MHTDDVEDEDLQELIKISDIIHTPVRLAILMFLKPRPNALFPEIKNVLNLTSGNLSSHIAKLSKAGFIYVVKKFVDAKPTTELTISPLGEKALEEYVIILQKTLNRINELI